MKNKPKNILTIQLNLYDPTMLKFEAERWAEVNGYKYDDDAHLFADFILTEDSDNITSGYSFHNSPELEEE